MSRYTLISRVYFALSLLVCLSLIAAAILPAVVLPAAAGTHAPPYTPVAVR